MNGLPQLRVTAFGAGQHFLAEEHPDRVVALVAETIREHTSAAGRKAVLA